MLTRLPLALAFTPLFAALTATAALADTWVLLIQPAPFTRTPPPYSQWQPYQQFDDVYDCLEAPMALHYQFWQSDQDLSMRALNGVCRNESTGKIVTGAEDDLP